MATGGNPNKLYLNLDQLPKGSSRKMSEEMFEKPIEAILNTKPTDISIDASPIRSQTNRIICNESQQLLQENI
jgi:hypothetical protein